MKVDYSEIIDVIVDGLVKEKTSEYLSILFARGSISQREIENLDIVTGIVRSYAQSQAYSVLKEIKLFLGEELIVMEDEEEVEFK